MIQLTFQIKGGGEEMNGKCFEESFKPGQDFEFVKYKLSTLFDVDQEHIVLKFI